MFGKVVMVSDVSRALFEAPVRRSVCMELPDEALSEEERSNDVVGHLYLQSVDNPSIYYHKKLNIKTLLMQTTSRSWATWSRQFGYNRNHDQI